jgi:hypothetical protein
LYDTLRDQDQGEHQRQRQQDIERGAGEVDPEVADRIRFLAREASNQGQQHGDAGSGRHEILHGERRHLRQVAHRALATVALPVGVGGEAGGGVER